MKTRLQGSRSLAKVLRSRYWKEEDAREVLAAWSRSGGSALAFARGHGLSPVRLLRWKTRLSATAGRPLFHPVKVIATDGVHGVDTNARPTGSVELVVRSERRILVRRGFDPEVLAELVRAVESWEC
jgi:hypothetical protein